MVDKKILGLIGLVLIILAVTINGAAAREWSIKVLNNSIPPKFNHFYTFYNDRIYFGYSNVHPSGLARYNIPGDAITILWETEPHNISLADGFLNTTTRTLWTAGQWKPQGTTPSMPANATIGKWDMDSWLFTHTERAVADDTNRNNFGSIVEKNSTYIFAGEFGKDWDSTGAVVYNGGGIWSIPKANFDDNSTWDLIWEEPNGWDICSMVKFNNGIYALARNKTFCRDCGSEEEPWRMVLYSDFKIYRYNETSGGFDEVYSYDNKDYNVHPHRLYVDNGELKLLFGHSSGYVYVLYSEDGENWHNRNTRVPYVQSTKHYFAACENDFSSVAGYTRGDSGSVYEGYGGSFRVYRVNLTTDETRMIREFSGSCFALNPNTGWDSEGNFFYFFAFDPAGGSNILLREGMHEMNTVNIRAKNAKTDEDIPEFEAVMGSYSGSTTTGTVTFTDVSNGYYTLQVVADGYYLTEKVIEVSGDLVIGNMTTNVTVYLEPREAGAGMYYPPHYVRLKFQECKFLLWFCDPVVGATVNVTGVSANATNITMNGTTGTDGAVGFEMRGDIKYRLNVSGDGWNYVFYLYPVKDEYVYTIVTGKPTKPSIDEAISWNFSSMRINDTHRYFNFSYNDTTNHTASLTFRVYRAEKDEFYIYNPANRTELYNLTLTNTNRYEFSYIAENWSGNTFIVGFNATFNDSYYEPMEEYRVYKFKRIGRLLDLGLENEFWYTVISICLLFLVGAIFSSLTVEVGAVVTSGFAGVLNYIGWLSYPGDKALITTAIIISILIYMNKRAKEEGVA